MDVVIPALKAIPGIVGMIMLYSPVQWSKLMHWLAEPQLDFMRGRSLFDWYFPDRVAASRYLRGQMRVVGVVFVAFSVMLFVSA